jgi:hypothetical protein
MRQLHPAPGATGRPGASSSGMQRHRGWSALVDSSAVRAGGHLRIERHRAVVREQQRATGTEDTTPSTGRGPVAGSAANLDPVDSPAAKSAVSTRREPGGSRTSCLGRQNTADRRPVPGKDGGRDRGTPANSLPELGCQQNSHRQQAPGPAPHGGWVRRPRGIGHIWNRSFPATVWLAQQLPGLLPAMEAVNPRRRRPIGQHREGLLARTTQTPANPNPSVPLIVCLLEPPPVTDNRPTAAQGASPGQQGKRDLGHPGTVCLPPLAV